MESLLDNPQYKERWAMYESALAVGLPIVSRETCAIICAMLLVWRNQMLGGLRPSDWDKFIVR